MNYGITISGREKFRSANNSNKSNNGIFHDNATIAKISCGTISDNCFNFCTISTFRFNLIPCMSQLFPYAYIR